MVQDYAGRKAWEAKQKYISSTGGKGSVRRKTDEEQYRENYDKIFGKKELKDGKLQPKKEQGKKET
jgi:hypothetical protein